MKITVTLDLGDGVTKTKCTSISGDCPRLDRGIFGHPYCYIFGSLYAAGLPPKNWDFNRLQACRDAEIET